MKTTITWPTLVFLLLAALAFAEPIPKTIGYQGYLKNSDGTSVNGGYIWVTNSGRKLGTLPIITVANP